MKKFAALLLIAVLLTLSAAFAACGGALFRLLARRVPFL